MGKRTTKTRGRKGRRKDGPAAGSSTRMRILQGAARAFGEHGYAACRVEDILQESGVSRPTFYRFFSNKDDALDALDEIASMSLVQLIRGAVRAVEEPAAKLEAGLEAYLHWQAGMGPAAQVLRQHALLTESPLAERRAATQRLIVRLFADEMEVARALRVDPLVFEALVAAVEAVAGALHREHSDFDADDIARAKRTALRILQRTLTDGEAEGAQLPLIDDLPPKKRKELKRARSAGRKQRRKEKGADKEPPTLDEVLWLPAVENDN